MVHHLYDWDLTFSLDMAYDEEFNTALSQNEEIMKTVFSIFVQWKPIPEIKKEITGEFSEHTESLNIGG